MYLTTCLTPTNEMIMILPIKVAECHNYAVTPRTPLKLKGREAAILTNYARAN